jgi:hypothetical protein
MTDQYQVPLDRTAGTPLEEGIHLFSVKAITEGESKAENPMWTIELACLEPGQEGKTVRLYAVLTEAARWKFENFLDAVGAPATGMATASMFVGKRLRAQIVHEEFDGKPQAKVGEMFPATVGNPAVKPMVVRTTATTPAAVAVPSAVKPMTPRPAARPVDVTGKGKAKPATKGEIPF